MTIGNSLPPPIKTHTSLQAPAGSAASSAPIAASPPPKKDRFENKDKGGDKSGAPPATAGAFSTGSAQPNVSAPSAKAKAAVEEIKKEIASLIYVDNSNVWSLVDDIVGNGNPYFCEQEECAQRKANTNYLIESLTYAEIENLFKDIAVEHAKTILDKILPFLKPENKAKLLAVFIKAADARLGQRNLLVTDKADFNNMASKVIQSVSDFHELVWMFNSLDEIYNGANYFKNEAKENICERLLKNFGADVVNVFKKSDPVADYHALCDLFISNSGERYFVNNVVKDVLKKFLNEHAGLVADKVLDIFSYNNNLIGRALYSKESKDLVGKILDAEFFKSLPKSNKVEVFKRFLNSSNSQIRIEAFSHISLFQKGNVVTLVDLEGQFPANFVADLLRSKEGQAPFLKMLRTLTDLDNQSHLSNDTLITFVPLVPTLESEFNSIKTNNFTELFFLTTQLKDILTQRGLTQSASNIDQAITGFLKFASHKLVDIATNIRLSVAVRQQQISELIICFYKGNLSYNNRFVMASFWMPMQRIGTLVLSVRTAIVDALIANIKIGTEQELTSNNEHALALMEMFQNLEREDQKLILEKVIQAQSSIGQTNPVLYSLAVAMLHDLGIITANGFLASLLNITPESKTNLLYKLSSTNEYWENLRQTGLAFWGFVGFSRFNFSTNQEAHQALRLIAIHVDHQLLLKEAPLFFDVLSGIYSLDRNYDHQKKQIETLIAYYFTNKDGQALFEELPEAFRYEIVRFYEKMSARNFVYTRDAIDNSIFYKDYRKKQQLNDVNQSTKN